MAKKPGGDNSIKGVFENLLDNYQIKDKFSEATLISSWEKLMGKTIARRTVKLFIKGRTLFVELNSAALKHEMNLSKQKILGIFEKELGAKIIDDVVFL